MKTKPIRVLCVFSTLDRGGAESMCMNLYRSLDRDKVQFDFVKHDSRIDDFEEEIEALGGKIFEAPRYTVTNHFQYVKWWKTHLKKHPEHKIVHGHLFTIASIYFKIAKKRGCITIGHSHCSEPSFDGIKRRLKKIIVMRTEKFSDYCFACSCNAGEWLFPHKQFVVLNNAVDVEQYEYNTTIQENVRSELNISDDLVIGTVGSIKEVKNPMGILDIYEAVRNVNSNAKLLWVGDGPMREIVEERIKMDGIQDGVILTGVRSDVNRLMQAMDVFVLPSFSEGLPVVTIEAQASGLTCLLSDNVTNEADLTGRCHYLPLDMPNLWAEEILSLDLERKNTTQEIIDHGYDINTTAEWLQEFYLSIAKNEI